MSERVEEILDKYEPFVLKNIDTDNMNRIIEYLIEEKVDYIDELLVDYLDLFLIESEEFKQRFQKLKINYGDHAVELIKDDLNLLEEL